MKTMELVRLLDIPEEVEKQLADYENSREIIIPDDLISRILERSQWDDSIKKLQELLGDDPAGIKILWELLHIVSTYSYEEYGKRGIPDDIFIATMKFCTRYLREHDKHFGEYKFKEAWWFPRQISLCEYRIGALEYEFVDGEEREIAIHIPADADMRKESVARSLEEFEQFKKRYYPQWENVSMTCDTWMLMPELKEFLGEDSNIIAFQDLFEIDIVNHDATWYRNWIFPGAGSVDTDLPEDTTLQRSLKKYLLAGNKFGVAKGHLVRNVSSVELVCAAKGGRPGSVKGMT